VLEIPHDLSEGTGLGATGFFFLVHRDRRHGGLGHRTAQSLQTFLGVAGAIHHRITGDDAGISLSGPVGKLDNGAATSDFVHAFSVTNSVNLMFIGAADHVKRLVSIAVERISIGDRLQASNGRHPGFAHVIETSDAELALGQHFLHFA
jgi:hypothetical protein